MEQIQGKSRLLAVPFWIVERAREISAVDNMRSQLFRTSSWLSRKGLLAA